MLHDATILDRTAGPQARVRQWIGRWYILAFCFGPAALMFGVFAFSGIHSPTIWGHVALGLGTYGALRLLADRPLLNPIQAVVFLFHFWFGLGAASCAAFYLATREFSKFEAYYSGSPATLLIVAAGLPLYAFAATLALRLWPERLRARFLEPEGVAYRPQTLLAYFAVGGLVYALLFGLQTMGVRAFDTVNYLGGTVSSSPVLAAVSALTQLATGFALYGFLHAWYAEPGKVWRFRMLGVLALLGLVGVNLFSGSKGMVVFLILVPLILCMTFRQRAPWVSLAVLGAAYLFVLQPFVDSARMVSEAERITTPEQRKDLFQRYVGSGAWSVDRLAKINMESPFRYMYAAANRVTPLSDDLSGPWEGRSLRDGVSSMTPRFLDKEKADSNMGNFFARELGLAHPHNFMHNVTITIPFEIVGNYGWIAGILSFGVLGLAFACCSAWLLSKRRLATHPLAPMTILMLLKVEASFGQFVNAYKGFPVTLLVAWGIWHFLGRRL